MKPRSAVVVVVVASLFGMFAYAPVVANQGNNGYLIHLPMMLDPRPYVPQVKNPDFELGGQDWTEHSNKPTRLPLITANLPGGTKANSGQYAVNLMQGSDDETENYISQDIIVEMAGIEYYMLIQSDNGCLFQGDIAEVVYIPNGQTPSVIHRYHVCRDNNTFGWIRIELDLSLYTELYGSKGRIVFRAKTDTYADGTSQFLIDDVRLTDDIR